MRRKRDGGSEKKKELKQTRVHCVPEDRQLF